MSARIGFATGVAFIALLSACVTTPPTGSAVQVPAEGSSGTKLTAVAHPAIWPKAHPPTRQPAVEARIESLLSRMSIEDKVGQLLQVDIASIEPSDLRQYKLGSILNGGNSAPNDDELAPPREWLALADQFYAASMERSDDRPAVPVIWGTDAVHGNNNIVGATIFPHNIGLGAMRNPELVRRIGEVTAAETAAAGIGWSFAPTLAVVQDDRWGRTYESYSEDPRIVASYAGEMIKGIQGVAGTADFMAPGKVIATAKHFVGDGGTGGRDQGDTRTSEAVLRDVHAAGYYPAVDAGTLTAMVSFSAWNGEKMHGNRSLLTGVLKDRMGFDGLLVGDWNAHGQLDGCTNEDCPDAINAGLDMFMYSGPEWKKLYENTLADARNGTITAARLDDAVRRILRVKLLSGTFEAGKPSSRPLAGRYELFGAPAHRGVAREAVRQSMVLLKNNNGVLPLNPTSNILVAGKGADSINQQSGGWTITWQGTDVANKDFPNAQTIWSGISEAVNAAGGRATLSVDGSFEQKPDAAIVVFGEEPYAEFVGDRPNLEYKPEDKSDLDLLKRLKGAGIPVIAVFLSGRPMWVNAELNASDAFVAAFLPGSEGGGVADVLLARADGAANHDFRGKLSFSWPKRPDQFVLNRRDPDYDPLFAFGYGLSYSDVRVLPVLDETRPAGMDASGSGPVYGQGKVPTGWTIALGDADQSVARVNGNSGRSVLGTVELSAVDRAAQEDARQVRWSGANRGSILIEASSPIDLTRETNGELSLLVDLRVDSAPSAAVDMVQIGLGNREAAVPITGLLRGSPVGQWTTIALPLQCFRANGLDPAQVTAPFGIATEGAMKLSISGVRIARADVPMNRCGG